VFTTAHGVAVGGFGRSELALVSGLDWLAFRQVFDLSQTPRLEALRAHWQSRPSVAATAPAA
jgi:UTP:GlnB (protein PII) uridylyltransferase